MTTYTQWLRDQESRPDTDPIGWFARFWRDLDQRPRLSSTSSITKHLEDRGLFQSVNGLTEAHDRTLAAYRAERSQTVSAASGVPAETVQTAMQPLPGMPAPPVAQAVQNATRAGKAAGERATQLDRIEAALGVLGRQTELIVMALGLATDADDGALPWGEWFAAADMAAEA